MAVNPLHHPPPPELVEKMAQWRFGKHLVHHLVRVQGEGHAVASACGQFTFRCKSTWESLATDPPKLYAVTCPGCLKAMADQADEPVIVEIEEQK